MPSVGDIYMLDSQPIRLRIVEYFPARPAQAATQWMPALPPKPATFVVMEMDGPTPGATWTATETFFEAHCTRVREGDKHG